MSKKITFSKKKPEKQMALKTSNGIRNLGLESIDPTNQ